MMNRWSKGTTLLTVMCFGSLATMGCGAGQEPKGGQSTETVSSDIIRAASPAAQKEFGIGFWKVGGTGAVVVTGLDADGQRVAEFQTKLLKNGNIQTRQTFPIRGVDVLAPDGSLVVAKLNRSSKRILAQAAADLKDAPVGYDGCTSALVAAGITCGIAAAVPSQAASCVTALAIAAWECRAQDSGDSNDSCSSQNGSEGTCGNDDSSGGGGGGSSGSES